MWKERREIGTPAGTSAGRGCSNPAAAGTVVVVVVAAVDCLAAVEILQSSEIGASQRRLGCLVETESQEGVGKEVEE